MARDAKLRFYTTEKLGPNQELTPEKFLLCKNVAIARTGSQIYGPGETPIEVGNDGTSIVTREAKEVFHPDTIASFHGKPVVDDHPEEDVTPANWAQLAKGTVMDPRRGEGIEDHLLIADLLITDKAMIEAVLEGKVEVSCGYDADYEEDAPGRGRQVGILGNHVAIVEAGRCGPRCAIRDSARKSSGGTTVAKKTLTFDSVTKSILKRFRDGDKSEEALKKVVDEELEKVKDAKEDEEGEGDTHIHIGTGDKDFEETRDSIKALDARIKDLEEDKKVRDAARDAAKEDESVTDADEEELEKEAEEGKGKDARKARDSAYMGESFQSTLATAEILAPGISFPTFDAKQSPKKTLDQMCQFRRKALGIAAMTPAGATLITEHVGRAFTGDSLSLMKCGEVRSLFNSVGATMRVVNSSAKSASTNDSKTEDAPTGLNMTPAAFNKRAADFWKDRD